MTIEEINELTLESTFEILLGRILDLSSIPNGEPVFLLDQEESLPFYDRIIVHQSLVKPPLENLNTELSQYKAELTTKEEARLAEIQRIEGIEQRFDAIPDINLVFVEAGLDITNAKLEKKRIILDDDQTRLSFLETKSAELIVKQNQEATLKQESDIVDGLVDICLGCIKIVMKHNISNSLTKEQKDQQALDYAGVFTAIRDWRPGKAKSLISALTPDGTLVTQALKDELLTFLTSKGL